MNLGYKNKIHSGGDTKQINFRTFKEFCIFNRFDFCLHEDMDNVEKGVKCSKEDCPIWKKL